MDIKEELVSSFEFINLTLDDKVLKKCEELCETYNIEPEEFVNIWCAHAALAMWTDAPTIERLENLEKKKLQKHNKDKSLSKTPSRTPKKTKHEQDEQSHKHKTNEPAVKNTNNEAVLETLGKSQIEDEFLEPFPTEPEVLDVSITSHLSSTQEATKYKDRSNALSVRVSIGKEPNMHINKKKEVHIKLLNEDCILTPEAKYMYEVMGQKISCLNSITNWIGMAIAKKNNLMISSEISTKNHIGSITTYGKIFVDGIGHLNLQSIMLEGTAQINQGHSVHLNVDKVKKLALFPGQIVVVKGKMLSGNKLVAENIYTNACLDLPLEPPVIEDPLRIIVAAGPYTLNEDLNYDPMRDFLNYVADKQPHALILMGPFVDERHPIISTGDMTETFDIFFENLIESISAALQDMPIQIVVISSMKDAHHHCVYPTPPYKTREKYQNIKFFPDPCVLKIDGLVVGATTADIMYHIAKQELVTSKDSDTMSRLPSHILQQQNFYPLYPPSTEINVSHKFLESYGMMECLPHLLILPSTFRAFIRNINDCVVINPERLARGSGGGAFADIIVTPGTSLSVTNRIHCNIFNI